MNQAVTAYQKFIRQSPRKMRLVADLIRGMSINHALDQLAVSGKRAATSIKKVVLQAQANAVNNANLDKNSLTIERILIEEGPTFKRWNPVSRGRAHPILKRTSHIKVIVTGKEPMPENNKKPTKK
jgi:large subunit ribosomal protein L22